INEMIDTLATFADQVTSVAREVGVEGVLGGQALVPGAAGTWKDLTDNVNGLAANLTTQVRAIAEVATAVTKGDLTRSIAVEARGEVAALKDNINEMIRNLKDTTQKNTEQDWLKTNLAKFTSMLQGQRDLLTVANLILSEVAPLVRAQHGVFYLNENEEGEQMLKLTGSYAYQKRKHLSERFRLREGLVGQCALEKQRILMTDVPDDYVKIGSGLGEGTPLSIVALPILFEGEVRAVIELASFHDLSDIHLAFLDQLTESIGIVLNTIEANMRTENLLKQSQSLAQELQAQQMELQETNTRLEQQAKTLQASEDLLTRQQEELQQTNEELEEKARLLAMQNAEVERKNREIEQGRASLEDKAEQLALTSKYKSEFLANMSHELRTPLNSLLILSKLLADNSEGNLVAKQVEFAKTIHAAGSDLLDLINDILDLSKIESGTISSEVGEVFIADLKESVARNFTQLAENKSLDFDITVGPDVPNSITTDSKRLQQILKNLLANAFKFTEEGSVSLDISVVESGWNPESASLNAAPKVIAFAVSDSGIGIPKDKQRIIFEAFQQADGSTSRKYGGTGLGLPISRAIADLLGGEIKAVSAPGEGSTFTLYLPTSYTPQAAPAPVERFSEPFESRVTDYTEPLMVGETTMLLQNLVADDRGNIQEDDKVILIVEDDLTFARLLLDEARDHGFKALVAANGAEALALAKRYTPAAITLDIKLPDMDGWTVMDRLKNDPTTRHIPV
ncbi:MAG TPA: ATP-binding protein, partial [Chroococcales cyanobacterium]